MCMMYNIPRACARIGPATLILCYLYYETNKLMKLCIAILTQTDILNIEHCLIKKYNVTRLRLSNQGIFFFKNIMFLLMLMYYCLPVYAQAWISWFCFVLSLTHVRIGIAHFKRNELTTIYMVFPTFGTNKQGT